MNQKLIGPNYFKQFGPIFTGTAGFRLLDRNLAAFDFYAFAARQGFAVAIGKRDEAAAAAELNRITGGNLQLGFTGTFGHDDGLSAGIAVFQAGRERWSGHNGARYNGACKNDKSKLVHFTPVFPPPLLHRA